MIVGIDLGTTHSLIGRFDEFGSRLFPNALGDVLTPSVVSVDDAGHMIIGHAARDRMVSHPEASVASFKRWMGTSHETKLGERSFRPEELWLGLHRYWRRHDEDGFYVSSGIARIGLLIAIVALPISPSWVFAVATLFAWGDDLRRHRKALRLVS